jgi:hypothetical protein
MNRKISGLYKGFLFDLSESEMKKTELELRVDVDGTRPLNIVSGDFYEKSKNKKKYLSSFRFEVKKIISPTNKIILIGKNGEFSSNSSQFANIKISIYPKLHPTIATFQGTLDSKSKIQFFCKYVSKYFRTVYIEHDYEEGVEQLEPYDMANSFSPSQHRSDQITIIDAFAEAGIEIIVVTEKRDSVPSPKGTPINKAVWTNTELTKALQKHFTLFKDEPQWTLWLLSAKEYVLCNVYGISISCKGKKRRGCAVFQNSTGWKSSEEKRFRLFIYVHELGHCFNLPHPWDKPQTELSSKRERYSSLSWMNLPWRYYSSKESRGEETFWESFDFQFDSSELIHLRHGFRNDVMFGSKAFKKEIGTKSATKRVMNSIIMRAQTDRIEKQSKQ